MDFNFSMVKEKTQVISMGGNAMFLEKSFFFIGRVYSYWMRESQREIGKLFLIAFGFVKFVYVKREE